MSEGKIQTQQIKTNLIIFFTDKFFCIFEQQKYY